MMRMFKRKPAQEKSNTPFSNSISKRIDKTITELQTKVAKKLSDKEKTLTTKQKKWALFIFCAGMCLISGALLYKGIFNENISAPHIDQQTITRPGIIKLPDSLDLKYLEEFRKRQQALPKMNDSANY